MEELPIPEETEEDREKKKKAEWQKTKAKFWTVAKVVARTETRRLAHWVYESPTSLRVLGFLSGFLVLVSSVFSLVMDLFSGQFSAFVIGFSGRAPGDAATAEHLRACADRLLPLPEGVAVYTLEISGVWIDETGVMTSAGSCVFSGPLKPSKKLYKKYAESHPSLRQRVDSGEARVELVVTTKVENAQLRKTDLRHLVMGLHEAVEKA